MLGVSLRAFHYFPIFRFNSTLTFSPVFNFELSRRESTHASLTLKHKILVLVCWNSNLNFNFEIKITCLPISSISSIYATIFVISDCFGR
ncbi:unnamed protein product [Lactuca virosa]|uniref:Uncharacterized protein n=1 Tax=Lactuca virosa TaxID=75947 RepID=A0AAU9MI85_9ASTR|nr:unnamed protein product [Lactuca virosa]